MIAIAISIGLALVLALLCHFQRFIFFLTLMGGGYFLASQYKMVAGWLDVSTGNIGMNGKNMVYVDIYNEAAAHIKSAITIFPIAFVGLLFAITFYMRVLYKPHEETIVEKKKRVRKFYSSRTY